MKLKFILLSLFSFISLNAADHFVSFIIPCYNCASTVEESIDSIYQQNLKYPFEVICTDDGSTDNTLDVLKHCQSKYPNLFVYVHEKNKGGGAARNTCISHSRGDLIFCLDSDNVLFPCSVNRLIDLMDQEGCDIVAFEEGKAFKGNFIYIKSYPCWIPGHTYTLYDWVSIPGRNPSFSGNYLYTRKSYDRAGGYPEDVGAADTFGFGLAQLATGSIMKTLPGSFYWHRLDDNSYYMREERKNANTRNHAKVLIKFYEIFSEKTQEILDRNNAQEIWANFHDSPSFQLASSKIIHSLFRAYNFKYEKKYSKAAEQFSKAIKRGCRGFKIYQCMEEMQSLSEKIKESNEE